MAEKSGAIPKLGIPMQSKTNKVTPKPPKDAPFTRSERTMRTPPKETTFEANESIYLCQICLVEDGIEKIQCDKCMLWYHFACAKLTKDVLKQDAFICFNCVEIQQQPSTQVVEPNDVTAENPSGYSSVPPQMDTFLENPANLSGSSNLPPQTDQIFGKPPSVGHKSNRSRKTSSIASTVSRRTALALQKLEEERQLLEKREIEAVERQRERDKEYLNQKYSILEDDAMSNLSFDDQEVEQQKLESIQQWAKNVPIHTTNNLLDNDHIQVDKEIKLKGPQLNSTVVTQQQNPNDAVSTPNVDVSSAISTIESHPIDSLVRTYYEGAPVDLPNWLTHPSLVESVKPQTWLTPELRINRETPSQQTISTHQDGELVQQNISQPGVIEPQVPPVQLSSVATESQVQPVHLSTNAVTQELTSNIDGQTSHTTNVQQQLAVVYNQTQPSFANNPNRTLIQPQTTTISRNSVKLSTYQDVGQSLQSNACHPSYQPIADQIYQQYQLASASNQQANTAVIIQTMTSQSTAGNASIGTTSLTSATLNNQITGGNNQLITFSPLRLASQTQTQSSVSNNIPLLSNSQSFGNGQSIDNKQMFGHQHHSNQLSGFWHSQPSQSFNVNQSTSQPRYLGANQQQWTSQPQVLGPSRQLFSSNNQPFISSQPFDNGQQFSTSQMYNQPQAQGFGHSFPNCHQHTSSNPSVGQSSIGNVPVSQPINMNNASSASQGINQHNNSFGVLNQSDVPVRLTVEQIASRHVMPKELPHFHGDPRQWYAFISAYDNSNETCGFSNSENLGRLQKCLKGEAETAVKSRLFHKDSVPGVIETLRLLYGRPELIMETLLADIQTLPAPKDDDLPALIKFAMAVQNLSATIKHCGASEHLRNPMLINSIVDKLPAMHRVNWAFHKQMIGNVNIGHLGDWLYQMADVLSQVVRVSSKSSKKQEPQQNNRKNKSESTKPNPFLNTQVETTSAKNQSNTNQSNDWNKKICPACSSNECTTLTNCNKFKDATLSERWTIIKTGKICGRCFGNHKFYRCQSNQSCSVTGCNAHHHKLLHNYESFPESTASKDTEKNTCNSQNSKSRQRADKFRIVPVMLHFKNKSVRDYAYLDEGSNMTTMDESLANELELNGTPKELCIDWAFGQTHSATDSKIVSVKISGYYDNAPRFTMDNVRTVKNLHLPTQSISTNWIDQYHHFKNVPIATYESAKPRLLIGLQYSRLIVSLETIEGKNDEPIVCRTRLGWVVQGPTYESDKSSGKQTFSMNMCVCQSNDNKLHQLVKNYFSMEHLGIKIPEKSLESMESQRAKQILDSTTVKKGDRYETGLLWKHDDVELSDSYNMAIKRLICLETKMAKNPDLKAKLFTQMKEFVEKGYIRKLSEDEVKNCKHRVWYLPTFPVFNPKKPEKVRLVWDGAAKVKNTSLNSNLLVGPDELVPLPELLRRFREREVGLTGDIAEMFHQIQIQESDQHAQRFLWREDPSLEPDIYVMMVMTFGSKCSPSSAQYVKNKNAKEFENQFPRAVESIIHNHYVDDMIDSTDSIDEAETLVKELKMIHRSGGFNIRNFASNSKELLKRIGEEMLPKSKDLNIGGEISTERVLGMFWDTDNDSFTYSLKYTKVNENVLSGKHHPTKREVLRILMSVFDPFGLLANFLVHGKILLQEIWKSKIEWDEKISAPNYEKWSQWIRALPNVEQLQIPRWYSTKLSPKRSTSIQLHTFVDAGAEACCAVSYVRIEDEEGVDCCIVSAKTKVAPTKPMSIPRLELQAAVMGTRLATNVKISQRFTFEKEFYWTDSQTVMAWINSESRRFNQFVSFRIGEIIETTEINQWRWVPSKHNVADEATKSKVIPKLASDSRWFKAPAFLYEDEQNWLKNDEKFTTEEELRPCFVMSVREIQSQQLINLDRFSKWSRLVHVQAYVLRFVHNVKCTKEQRQTGLLSQKELIQSENCLYQRAQKDIFMDEILILKHNEKVPLAEQKVFEKSSELRTFSPYLDENNVLRQKGRIDAADSIAYDTKRPIILPRRHRITKLLVDWFHRRYKHLNHQTALNEIRQKFIIPALRVVMKGVRNSCQKCKNSTAMPRIPEMSGLPPTRLATFTRPFTFTGVDYFGPYAVKVNRSVVPRYGVIFTCLTTRAIHLEVADSLNTSSCIDAVRRFSARKGNPRKFHSDNGTNFHGADNDLKKEFEKLNQNRIQQEFTTTEQEWTFNPPLTSHMGGVWERLIQTVKKCLNQMLTTKTPTQEMLTTLMAEVENIVNSRPLTYISLDSADDEALTPNHFLFGSSNALTPIADTTPRDLNRNDWRAIQEMTKHFWHRFVLEYLPDLTKRTKWLKQVEPIVVGDVVLVIDERNPRNTWPKGIVEEVFVAKDGCIRQVMVRFGKRALARPVSKLAILEVKPPNKDDKVKLSPMESVNGGKNVAKHSFNYSTTINC